ncbi:RBBP9/YdeN family alpha/beta hydrolase [Endozoicomonadaceae bacterium StTr2]
MKIIFIHGNGGCTAEMHWYPSVAQQLKAAGLDVVLTTFPDNEVAHMNVWIPFLRNELKAGEDSILVGHSSGALAAMRFAEQYPIIGSVLVAACYTDQDDENEKAGGWYDKPWGWQQIKQNQQWIIQFASTNDHCIPISEARFVAKALGTEYFEFNDRGHFSGREGHNFEFPELTRALLEKIQP